MREGLGRERERREMKMFCKINENQRMKRGYFPALSSAVVFIKIPFKLSIKYINSLIFPFPLRWYVK